MQSSQKAQYSQKRKLDEDDDPDNVDEPTRFRGNQFTIEMILDKFTKQKRDGGWMMQPMYQREAYLWPTKRMQDLILTVFDDLPIPPIYLLVEKRGRGLFDGLQRISSLLQFKQDSLAVPIDVKGKGEGIPKGYIQAQYHDLLFAQFSHLTPKGVCFFNNYTMCVVEIHDVRRKEEYFKRLNYSLQQTQGERLHSSNSLRSQQISQLVKEHLHDKLIEPDNATGKRAKAFERMCCFFFLESKEGGWDNFTNKEVIMDFILQKEPFSDPFVTQVMQQVKAIRSKVYDVHLLSLLLAAKVNKDVLVGYDFIIQDKKLRKSFNRLLPNGNGKCKPCLEKTKKWFLALAHLSDVKLRCKFLRFKKSTLKTKDDCVWKILEAVREWWTTQKCKVVECVNPLRCIICGLSITKIMLVCDGGLCERTDNEIAACEKCGEWLSVLSSTEASAFLRGEII